MPSVSRYQLCCGCMPIFSGIFAIVFHSFLHSVYGICIILTSYYTVQDDLVNYVALASYVCLLIIGVPILWVVIGERISGIKFMGTMLVFVALFNLSASVTYYIWYFPFEANSLLDKLFLWKYGVSWVNREISPFTAWHVLTGFLILLTPLWFYYAYVIFFFTKYIKLLESQEPYIPEIIYLENRIGPFMYRAPEGYPYSTNQYPQYSTNQYQQMVPRETRQRDNLKSVLD